MRALDAEKSELIIKSYLTESYNVILYYNRAISRLNCQKLDLIIYYNKCHTFVPLILS